MARGWNANDIPDLTGRIAVVTGANSGIGFETARQLAMHGARTVLACRDEKRAAEAADRIRAGFPAAAIECYPLDLASLASIRSFSQALHGRVSRVDILVNNAGVMRMPRRVTADGFEMQFGTNHLGHFALTGLLLDLIIASGAGRVVTVGSIVAWAGFLRFDDLQGIKRYSRWGAYLQSKLANLMFALELQRRLRNRNLPVISLACHPGYAATNLQTAASNMEGSFFGGLIYRIGNRLVAQTAARGALPSLYCSTHPDLKGGELIGPRGPLELWGAPGPARVVPRARDELGGRRLWDVSTELTNVPYSALARAA
jgi:NAD(P)-dependent dehydrogenase (short-subunit alcohol dehydrogenase family)